MTAYYNEIDPHAAQWLRNLIDAGHIAPGVVDTRSIEDVHPDDLRPYAQCHFFAGIGVWSYALRLAGWSDDRPVWTGSCPCQPFSAAGQGAGFTDERHLWPYWHFLIEECRPPVVFGEQVEAAIKHGWLDLVQSDLEGSGYAFGASGIPAAGVGAPHIRQRLFFVADALQSGRPERWAVAGRGQVAGGRIVGELADTDHQRCAGQHALLRAEEAGRLTRGILEIAGHGESSRLAHAVDGARYGSESRAVVGVDAQGAGTLQAEYGHAGPTNGFWRAADWLLCRDGKWRPVEPGTFPLAHGAPARVGRLRAYGNAIVAQAAAEFIKASMTG